MNRKSKLFQISIAFVTYIVLIACLQSNNEQDRITTPSLINFAHLEHLSQAVTFERQSATIVHIYSDYPNYNWVEATNEGVACVDDAARAAVVYLRFYEITQDVEALETAKEILNFILHMQADDGEFFNFVYEDLKINRNGRTSQKSFDFWAARGYWALGFGYRIFRSIDPDYAAKLQQVFLRCKEPIRKLLSNYGKFEEIDGRKYPTWLIHKYAAAASSELLLGLAEYLKTERDTELLNQARQLAQGLVAMQLGAESQYRGAFLSWKGLWHAWANSQTQALASSYRTLGDPQLLAAAEEEARAFYGRLLTHGLFKSFSLGNQWIVNYFPQIAYDLRTMVVGLIRLYEVTEDDDYAKLAGLAASWFFGNNPTGRTMYDVGTGRCYDGIEDSSRINLNSGAESTIEALYAVIETEQNPISCRFLAFKTAISGFTTQNSNCDTIVYRIFANDDDDRIGLLWNHNTGELRILEEKNLELFERNWIEHK